MIRQLLIVGLGGGAGTMVRYLLHKISESVYPNVFPWGTMIINMVGCLLIGLLWGSLAIRNNETLRLLFMTGFCGGFTTFSAYTLESIQLLKDGKTGLFFGYILGSVIIGLVATWFGILLKGATQ